MVGAPKPRRRACDESATVVAKQLSRKRQRHPILTPCSLRQALIAPLCRGISYMTRFYADQLKALPAHIGSLSSARQRV
jgi:hypothetical protein